MNKPLYIFLHVPKCAGSSVQKIIDSSFQENESLFIQSPKTLNTKNQLEIYREIICGGGVLKNENRCFLEFQNIDSLLKKLLGSLSSQAKNNLKIIYGHCAYFGIEKYFPEREIKYITFIREPKSHLISTYNYLFGLAINYGYQEKDILDLEQWITKNNFYNYLTKYFISANSDHSNIKNLSDLSKQIINTNETSENINKILEKFYFIGLTNTSSDFIFLKNLFGSKIKIPHLNKSTQKATIKNLPKNIDELLQYDQALYDQATLINKKMRETSHYKNLTKKNIFQVAANYAYQGSINRGPNSSP